MLFLNALASPDFKLSVSQCDSGIGVFQIFSKSSNTSDTSDKYDLRQSFTVFWSNGRVAVRMRGSIKSKGALKTSKNRCHCHCAQVSNKPFSVKGSIVV